MRVSLFVPCYVDQLWPEAALASVALLERLGVEVRFPEDQTCCGQPFLSAGLPREARSLARRFAAVFEGEDRVVCPSASCAAMARHQFARLLEGEVLEGEAAPAIPHVLELCEFLVDVLGVRSLGGRFPRRVGLQPGCHGVRELGLAVPSERAARGADKVAGLLASLEGLELVTAARPDECCGFGGSFAVEESAVSCRMGCDRLAAFEAAGAEVLTSTDASCLLHLRGLAARRGSPLRVMHVAEILAAGEGGA